MKTVELDIDPQYTEQNPDLKGFDLDAMASLGAYPDGSGGGIKHLAWEMQLLREFRERASLIENFVRKHQLLLARLSWSFEVRRIHPWKKQGDEKDLGVFVPEIELSSTAYDKRRDVSAHDIAALWPQAEWRRSISRWGDDDVRDYTADVDGVSIRILNAERLPRAKPVDRFGPCGPVKIKRRRHLAEEQGGSETASPCGES